MSKKKQKERKKNSDGSLNWSTFQKTVFKSTENTDICIRRVWSYQQIARNLKLWIFSFSKNKSISWGKVEKTHFSMVQISERQQHIAVFHRPDAFHQLFDFFPFSNPFWMIDEYNHRNWMNQFECQWMSLARWKSIQSESIRIKSSINVMHLHEMLTIVEQ